MNQTISVPSLGTQLDANILPVEVVLRIGTPVMGYNHGGVAEQLESLFPEGAVPLKDIATCVSLLESWYHQMPSVMETDNPFSLSKMQEGVLSVYEELIPPHDLL